MVRIYVFAVGIISLLLVACGEEKSTEPVGFYTILGEYNDDSSLQSVFVDNDIAFLIRFDSKMTIVDISDPTNPIFASSCDMTDNLCDIYAVSGYCYLTYRSEGLMQIFDVTDPYNPVLTGEFRGAGRPQDISVYNGYAFVVGHNENADSSGLYIVNVEDPQNPVLETIVNLPYYGFSISISPEYAYINGWQLGGPLPDRGEFFIIDISNPVDPILAGSIDNMVSFGHIFILDNWAYLARGATMAGNFYIINVYDPDDPLITGVYNHAEHIRGVEVFGAYAFCEDYYHTFVINVSDPHNPYPDFNYTLPYYGMTRCSDNYFLVLDGLIAYIIEITI
jgi:hypothetical protein